MRVLFDIDAEAGCGAIIWGAQTLELLMVRELRSHTIERVKGGRAVLKKYILPFYNNIIIYFL